MKKILPLLAISLLWAASGSAQDNFNKAGRTTYQFLKIGMGARSVALGEAAIANLQEVNAVFWNPAAITSIQRIEAAFNYTKWFADINIVAGAVGVRTGSWGVFAIDYINLDYGDIQEALAKGPKLDTRTGKAFGGSDLAVGLTFSRVFTDKLSIGVKVKYLREELFTYTSSLWGFDVGSYYNTGWRGIRLAMSAQNLSRQARWLHTSTEEQQKFELPIIFRIGWSIDLIGGENLFFGGDPNQHRLAFNMDAIHTNDYAERLHLGAEYWLLNRIALRSGYRFNYEEGNWSFGFGLQPRVSGLDMRIDYAYVSYDFLDSPHRLTVSFAF